MKVKDANTGLLTNFEVLDLLRSHGADHDPLASAESVTPSECRVYDYIRKTPAGTQTRESVQHYFKEIDNYVLTKAERLQIVNLRPSTAVEVHLIVEDCEERMTDEAVEQFIETIASALPPPAEPEAEDYDGEGMEDDAEEKSE
eukprot:c22576_g1_i1 orf=803-1234(-)